LLGWAEPILNAGGRAVKECRTAFVGIDVATLRNAIAVADGERGGEVRYHGEVDASVDAMCRTVKRIASNYDQVHFCYEAGPTGYGFMFSAKPGSLSMASQTLAKRSSLIPSTP
jgi:hypothetical protein